MRERCLLLYNRVGKSVIWVCKRAQAQEKITDSHFWIFSKIPNLEEWDKSQSGTWLGIPWLWLVSLCQILDFYGCSLNAQKYPKMESVIFFLWKGQTDEFYGIIKSRKRFIFVIDWGVGVRPRGGASPYKHLLSSMAVARRGIWTRLQG